MDHRPREGSSSSSNSSSSRYHKPHPHHHHHHQQQHHHHHHQHHHHQKRHQHHQHHHHHQQQQQHQQQYHHHHHQQQQHHRHHHHHHHHHHHPHHHHHHHHHQHHHPHHHHHDHHHHRQQLKAWRGPRCCEKPFTDPESAQKWRLSLAALLFFTVLLSDHLWLCAEATRPMDTSNSSSNSSSSCLEGPQSSEQSRVRVAHRLVRNDSLADDDDTDDTDSVTAAAAAAWGATSPAGAFLGERLGPETDLGPGSEWSVAIAGVCGTAADSAASADRDAALRKTMPFCNRYTLGDAVAAYSPRAEAEAWRCPGAAAGKGATEAAEAAGSGGSCRACLAEFVRRDAEARGKHREFEEMMAKYVPRGSLPGWTPRCKSEYRRWLCAELLAVAQSGCVSPRPCRLHCLAVLGACPFILPDSDDHLHGGLPGFLCPDFPGRGSPNPTHEPLCCDWWPDSVPALPTQRQQQGQQEQQAVTGAAAASEEEVPSSSSSPTSSSSSSSSSPPPPSSRACRPCCSSRLRLCALVLALLHAVVTVAALGHAPGPGGAPAADGGGPHARPGAPRRSAAPPRPLP
ncbi:NALCN channel auxiliary factor 1-like [Lampetra fluviatilis]